MIPWYQDMRVLLKLNEDMKKARMMELDEGYLSFLKEETQKGSVARQDGSSRTKKVWGWVTLGLVLSVALFGAGLLMGIYL